MRGLIWCLVLLCVASTAWPVDTGNKFVAPPIDEAGDGMSDGREGGETYADALVIPAIPYTDSGATCDNLDDITPSCSYSVAPEVVYAFTPAEDVTVDVDLCGSGYNTILEIQDGIGNPIGCNDDYCGPQSTLHHVPLLVGHTYYVIVDGHGGRCGSYVLTIEVPQECTLECPPSPYALREWEPDCYDGYVDHWNGGCNSTPHAFEYICPQPGPATFMCGKSGTYLCAGLSYRDTDWFEILGDGGPVTVEAIAEFPLQLLWIHGADCENLEYDSTLAEPCVWTRLGGQIAAGAAVWVWVGPAVFSGVPCGSDYILEFDGGLWCASTPAQPISWGEIKKLFQR